MESLHLPFLRNSYSKGGEDMEKNNNKVIAVVALFIAVIALAVGFATYSATLTISSHDVSVGSDTFSPNLNYKASSMSCAVKSEGATVTSAGSVSGTAWSGVQLILSQPGDYVTCTATVENTSQFDAYLFEINTASALSCEAKASSENPATTGVSEACSAMELSITQGSASATATSQTAASNNSITGVKIDKISGSTAGEGNVSFTIRYNANGTQANGDFIVHVPQVNLIYKTED